MADVLTPLDPLSLTSISVATWFTDLMVAQKAGGALWQQYSLMLRAMPLGAGVH